LTEAKVASGSSKAILSQPVPRFASHVFILSLTLAVGFLAPLSLHHRAGEAVAATRLSAPVEPLSVVSPAAPPSTASESVQLPPLRSYVVQPGDTIATIAEHFSLSVETIAQVNHLASADSLMLGQSLTLPPVDGSMVQVAAGERLAQLATQYRVDPAQVASINQLSGGDPLPGQLFVPAAAVQGPIARVEPAAPAADGPRLVHFLWPTTGVITQPFWQYHPGIDIANVTGTPVVAADGGQVTFAGWGEYGLYVEIDHGNGFTTVYGHLSQLQVKVGQQVRPGEGIGLMGSTGRSTGPHLHFEIREDGVPHDPMSFLP
jgi:murein DD-endopeptidase MepM/ murein hydrolase activator NlpD